MKSKKWFEGKPFATGEDRILKRSGKFARGCEDYESAHELRFCHHYNGSGPSGFGGAKEWPHLEAHFNFEEGQEKVRDEFGQQLAIWAGKWFRKRGL